jgi:MoxR-like ATPase
MTELDITQLSDVVREQSLRVQAASAEIRKVIVGQPALVDRLLIALLCRGHLLVEGVPGLAKTLAIKTLSRVLDLIGTLVFQPKSGEFTVRKGPVFAHLVLADEINRAPAKVQSALLEAMQERQVTIGDSTYPLPEPFLVFATQNPIEQEGTYPLPEAQVDRFLMKTRIDYPKKEEERQILDRMLLVSPDELGVTKRLDQALVLALAKLVRSIHLDERVRNYIVEIVTATRKPREVGLGDLSHLISFGASPRGTLAFSESARAVAFLRGRAYVVPEDVKEIARDVLRHRILLTYEAEAENVTSEAVVDRILERVEVP